MFNIVVHPGSILNDELTERSLSASELARQIAVPANRISQIVAGKRSISGDTALRLGHWFGMEPQFWMNLQSQYDLATARQAMGAELEKLPVKAA
jgi:antitoxin HigA-1